MSEAEAGASTTAKLIDALFEGSEPVDEGGFTLDPAAAAAKMKAFQYADRSRYLIPIVEALHVLDATQVSISGEGVDFSVKATAVALDDPPRAFHELFAHAIGSTKTEQGQALARLAVGVDMGLGHGSIERIVVSYSTGRETFTAEYREGAGPRIVKGEAGPAGVLRVFVDRPWSGTFATDGTATRELEHLREAVRYSPRPVRLGGPIISQQDRKLWGVRRGEGEGYRYELGLLPAGERISQLELWTNGVWVDRRDFPGIGARAVLHLDEARRDLSQLKIVTDERIDAVVVDLEREHEAILRELERADETWGEDRPPQWPMIRVDRVLERPERRPALQPATRVHSSNDVEISEKFIGVPIYFMGIGAGAGAASLLRAGQLTAGLICLLFFFALAGGGALSLAHLALDRRRRWYLFSVLLLVGAAVASSCAPVLN